jgi:thiazole synthase ThiGH ThiG subunit
MTEVHMFVYRSQVNVCSSRLIFFCINRKNRALMMVEETLKHDPERQASLTGVTEGLASADDAAVLAQLGYKQELRRNFTMIEIFGTSWFEAVATCI